MTGGAMRKKLQVYTASLIPVHIKALEIVTQSCSWQTNEQTQTAILESHPRLGAVLTDSYYLGSLFQRRFKH